MNITNHQSILLCIDKRALWYQKDSPTLEQGYEVLYQEVIDEIGTVSTASLTDSDTDLVMLEINTEE